jgi:hypothetical protein
MTADDLVERELMFNRFQRLIGELLRGSTSRTVFQPWEIEILLDIDACVLDPKRRIGILRQYARAVGRQLEEGEGTPMKLSEYLQRRTTRRPSSE